MSRRRKSSNPISLFSFQDIVTSVTGIMILVTLLMALDLSQRALDSPRVQTAVVSKQLDAAVSEAEEEIRQLEAQLAARDAALQRVAGYDRRRLLAETDDVSRHVQQLEAETLSLASQSENAQQRQAETEARAEARRDDMRLVQELSRKAAELQRQIEKLRSSNRVIYNSPHGASKAAWLVQLTDGAIQVAPMGRAAKPTVFAGASAQETADAFRQWAGGRDRGSEYFVLLIKPSGIDLFEQLREELTDIGFDLGFDVVDDNVTVIDPETGAGV